MTIREVTRLLDAIAPALYQESYDNTGLLTGDGAWQCTGVLLTLDATEQVILEAKEKNCNLVIAHHPIVFGGLKKITGRNYVERSMIAAIKNDIAIYAIHTNLDNILTGVNGKMADRLGLTNRRVLLPKPNTLLKLYVYVPVPDVEAVKEAIFSAGGGSIGNYTEVSFSINGVGSFKPHEGANPHIGTVGDRELVDEQKLEIVVPMHLKDRVVKAMIEAHPYEEVAYDLVPLHNTHASIGSGLIGELPEAMSEQAVLELVKQQFGLEVIRHTPLLNKEVKTVALCGGAGSFLTGQAMQCGADLYITADIKYHEFFDADGKLLLADIGHWESEQFTVDLLYEILHSKITTFALLKSEVRTNPVYYFT